MTMKSTPRTRNMTTATKMKILKKTDDADTDRQLDAQLFKEQVVNLQQKAVSRSSTLPHRDTRLLNRSEKMTT